MSKATTYVARDKKIVARDISCYYLLKDNPHGGARAFFTARKALDSPFPFPFPFPLFLSPFPLSTYLVKISGFEQFGSSRPAPLKESLYIILFAHATQTLRALLSVSLQHTLTFVAIVHKPVP